MPSRRHSSEFAIVTQRNDSKWLIVLTAKPDQNAADLLFGAANFSRSTADVLDGFLSLGFRLRGPLDIAPLRCMQATISQKHSVLQYA